MYRRLIILITSLFVLIPFLAFAGDLGQTTTSPALAPPDLGGLDTTLSIIKLIVAFIVVAGVMALVFKLMGKFGPTSKGKSGLIEVLETRMIAQKKHISVIRIAGQDMAVAVSENNISLLCTLNTAKPEPQQPPENSEFNQAMEDAAHQERTQP